LSPDAIAYTAIAERIRDQAQIGYWLEPRTSSWPPLFPLVLAGLSTLLGSPVVDSARLLNALIAGATVVVVALLARRLLGTTWLRALAVVMAVLAQPLAFVAVRVWSEPLFNLLVLLTLLVLAGVTLFTVAAVFLFYRQLLFVTFDPEVADSYGVRVNRFDSLFALILAATIVSTMQVLGVLLIAATIVIPAIVARLLTDSFRKMLFISTGVGAACGFAGMYVSYYVDAASGPTIVLVAAALFTFVFGLTSLLNRRKLSRLASGPGELETVGGPSAHLG